MALSTIPTRALTEQGVNFRNLIINGDMSIAQRGTSTSGVSNANGYYACDRWLFAEEGFQTPVFTISQTTDVPSGQGFANSFKIDCTTADTSLGADNLGAIQQRIEGQNLQHLKFGTSSAESTTLSFWVKSTKTGTYQVNMRNQDNASMFSQTYTISSSNTWQKVTMTFTGDTGNAFNNDNGESIRLEWLLYVGTNYTSGTFASTWSDNLNNDARGVNHGVNFADSTSNEWYITGVQLEVGTSASDFEFLPYDVNLQRCKRYYEIYERDATETHPLQCVAECDSAGRGECILYYKQKRAAPSISLTHTGAQWGRLNGGVNQYVTITGSLDTNVGIGKKATQIFATTGGTINTGEITFMRFTGTDKIEIDAEL